ncbi:SWIM zinc finger domain-containing protein [Paenibacillus glycanilyticus]|uniref:SWIM zinc finger family protein n=1 Tax=Paenibacillus glycanilyticus TaxID=126569 RepID=UPI00203CB556|nr:SWIM zinc finger family protein [Paenibacillus glycanilyticus]MCM3628451.1 SWIM zinc finger domain-containing protein [Paenibacillus glycanilyticus]
MATITEAYVDSLAPTAGAIKNGRDLVKKNSFQLLNETDDRTLLFGECKGSGKDPYRCSVDFMNEGSPVFRCSCPSRQFPCKHALGLLYARALGKAFATAEMPQDIADKRDKAEKREEKKKEAAAADPGDSVKPKRKVNKSALVKKIAVQLDGLGLLEKLVLQLTLSGLGSVDKKTLQMIEEQAKQLGNHYIPGAQAGLREFVMIMQQSEIDREAVYTDAMEQLLALRALTKKGKAYLEQRAADPESPMETDTNLEELLGHAWQLAELREYGRVQKDAELLQLAFMCYTDEARGEFADTGWWIDLGTGHIRVTRHLRPFRAARALREEDTFHAVVKTEELFLYPGELNPRVRWENATFREPGESDYAKIKSLAAASFPDVIKQVKNVIKNPLADKSPVMLVAFQSIEQIDGKLVLRDRAGKQLQLEDFQGNGRTTTALVSLLGEEELKDQAALVMFRHHLDDNRLSAQLMSMVTDSRIIRLLY